MYAIIHPIPAFDSKAGTEINFTWSGNQIQKVRCIIKDNENGMTVYDNTVETMKEKYLLPADSGLLNGKLYLAYITVFDINDTESDIQDIGTQFWCFTAPAFQLSIHTDDVVRSSSFLVSLTYSQAENEALDSCCISLYSYQGIQLQTSGTIYETDSISYLVSGLEDARQYYIRATGITVNGYPLDTLSIPFSVAYLKKQIFSTIEANNLADIGGIELRSNIISMEGQPDKEVAYLDGECADLRDNSVTYDIAYSVSGDSSHVFIFHSPTVNQKLFTWADEKVGQKVSCYYRTGSFENSDGEKGVIQLAADVIGPDSPYVLYSNYFPLPSDNENICVCVSRIGNFYDVKALVKLKTAEKGGG